MFEEGHRQTTLKSEELITLLIEIKSVINSPPLTFIYNDQEGVSYALTHPTSFMGTDLPPPQVQAILR